LASDTDRLQDFLRQGALFVDARDVADYAAGHIASAVNVPAAMKERYRNRVHQKLPLGRPIIVYCRSGGCSAAREVCQFLMNNGYDPRLLLVHEGGLEALSQAGGLTITAGDE
jgi:rhodanese-related sulfurtransferase